MLFPYSPLDFVEAIERERRESVRVDAKRIGLVRRLTLGLTAASRRLRARRPRAVPKPA
jgi:hypothetical protein